MGKNNVFEWLWLTQCLGCGSARIWDVMENFGTVREACSGLEDRALRNKLLRESERRNADRIAAGQIEELMEYCDGHNIRILTFDDEMYPERLRSIYNPPAALFCRGDLSCLRNDFSISVVGTRKPSDYSVRVTNALVGELCGFGITIVSGFAVGIDITANLAAVRNGGSTIAVLGCGLDHDYPPENIQYRDEIQEHGLFVSEYYPQAAGTRLSFPTRNRILSGLSLGTVVIEAAEKSGALITANMALSQGRDIFVLAPHDLFDRRYGGNVGLIRDGAVCLCGVKDIIYEYYENYGHKIPSAAVFAELPGGRDGTVYRRAERIDPLEEEAVPGEPEKSEEPERPEYDASGLEGDEAAVYKLLREAGKPIRADDLAEMCGMSISDLLMVLTDLELEGAVEGSAGQAYRAL